jgi:hypothetical protein
VLIAARRALLAGAMLAGAFLLAGFLQHHPEHLPWTPLDLGHPVGAFTGHKLQTLADASPQCRMLVAGHGMTPLPACPDDPAQACALTAAIYLWQREVVLPAARQHFGQPVQRVLFRAGCPLGTGPDRPTVAGRDITGFQLADGRVISVRQGWHGSPDERGFLHQVRDGACRVFATTRSPDYGSRNTDILHIDQGRQDRRTCD